MKKHLAPFGLSRDPKKNSRQVYDLLVRKGYKIYPINPNTEQIDSIKCYKSLDDINQKLDGAVIITSPKISLEVVRQCHQKGIQYLWFHLDTMDDEVKAYLGKNGMNYIYSCALLHHKEAGFPHT
jgi:predicted CoA-binding protein